MIALKLRGYFSSYWNIFDFIVVMAGLLEIILVWSGVNGGSGLAVLRAIRLLRVFKIATAWSTMKELITIVIKSFLALSNLTILLFMFIAIGAIMGFQVSVWLFIA